MDMKEQFEIQVGQEYTYTGPTHRNERNPNDITNGEPVELLSVINESQINIRNSTGRKFIVPPGLLEAINP